MRPSLGTDRDSPPPLELASAAAAPRLWLTALQAVDLACLSPSERRWGEALPERQRQRYWHSRAVMRQLVAPLLALPAAALPLHSPPGQPPLMAEAAGWLSLSHSGDALLIGYSREPIGVDLEPAARSLAADALMRRFYPAPEQAQLERLPQQARRQAVLTSWVLKEAAIKWRCRTLAAELQHWCYDHDRARLQHLGDGVSPPCCSAVLAGWRWAVVGEGCTGLTPLQPQGRR